MGFEDTVRWITTVPAGDANHKGAVLRATDQELYDALNILKNEPKPQKSRIESVKRELRKRGLTEYEKPVVKQKEESFIQNDFFDLFSGFNF